MTEGRAGEMRTAQAETWAREAKAWLSLIDGVLTGIEKTAWAVRGAYADVSRCLDDVQGLASDDAQAPTQAHGVPRLLRTGLALGQIVGSYRLYHVRAAFMPRRKARRLLDRLHERNARAFYAACVEHGGAFVKVGQLLSARPDLMPEAFVRELGPLQDAVPALPFSAIRATLERELGRPLDEAFRSFDETPLAAASIGQVHRAVMLDGTAVAVKVQRPGIAKLVRGDLKLLEIFLGGLRDSLPDLDLDTIVDELRAGVLSELDYVEEAISGRAVAAGLANEAHVIVPRVIETLCSGQVLTSAFVEGRKLTLVLDELAAMASRGDTAAHAEMSRLLGVLLHAYLKQILSIGAFQADPHPGNLLVTPDGKLVILDFGCSKTLTPEVKASYVALLAAFMQGERERMIELLHELGFRTRSGKPDTLLTFADALLAELREGLERGRFTWPEREAMLQRANAMLGAIESDPVTELPGDFVMIARVLGTLGGLFAHYQPDIAFAEHVLPVLGEALYGAAASAASAD
jgi:ubiquinone biosynthesis protein